MTAIAAEDALRESMYVRCMKTSPITDLNNHRISLPPSNGQRLQSKVLSSMLLYFSLADCHIAALYWAGLLQLAKNALRPGYRVLCRADGRDLVPAGVHRQIGRVFFLFRFLLPR